MESFTTLSLHPQQQQQQSIVNYPRNFNSFNSQRLNTIGSSMPRIPLSRSLNISHMPTAQPLLPLFSNYHLAPLIQQPQQQKQQQIPSLASSISSNTSHLTEQEILDRSFLNIFNSNSSSSGSSSISPNNNKSSSPSANEKKRAVSANIPVALNHQNKLVPTGQLNKPTPTPTPPPPPPNKEKNLIDLEAPIDLHKEMSALDLFDPLAQPKPTPKLDQSDQEETVTIQRVPSASKLQPPPQPPPLPAQLPVGDPLPASQSNKELKRRNGTKAEKHTHNKKTAADQRIERFDIIELEKLNEFESFERSVNELTAQINVENEKCDSKKLSNLIVFSPTLDCSITNKKTIKMTVKYSHTASNGIKYLQETLTPSLNATVETLVYQVLTLFDVKELNADKYLLKIHGSEEYLPIDATLSYLKYIVI